MKHKPTFSKLINESIANNPTKGIKTVTPEQVSLAKAAVPKISSNQKIETNAQPSFFERNQGTLTDLGGIAAGTFSNIQADNANTRASLLGIKEESQRSQLDFDLQEAQTEAQQVQALINEFKTQNGIA